MCWRSRESTSASFARPWRPAGARMDRPDVVVMTFDLAPSGVVTNALRIAGAAQRSGFKAEIWTVQDVGASHSALPEGVPVRSFGETIGEGYSRRDRRAAARQSADRLAAALKDR